MSSSGSGYAASTTVSRQTSLSSAAASSAAAMQAPSTSASPAGARLDSTPMRSAPGFGTHLGGERPRRRRGGVRIARPETRDGVEHGGAVAHRAGHDVPDDEPGPRLAVVGTERHPARASA